MAEYVILIVGDAERWWTTMSDEERRHAYGEYGRFGEELTKRGHKITGGAELHRPSEGKRITPDGTVTDGPFTEITEHVGGFYRVDTDDVDDLLEVCQILTAIGEGIEVRRVVTDEDRP